MTATRVGVGIRRIGRKDIYGLRTDHLAEHETAYFRITDGPGCESASYLIDLVDYAPEADLGLPRQGLQRLDLLLRWVDTTLDHMPTADLMLVLTDSSEVESTREVNQATVGRQLIKDSKRYAPPNVAYHISRSNTRDTAFMDPWSAAR